VWTEGSDDASTTFGPTNFSPTSIVSQSNNVDTGEAAVYITGNRFNIVGGTSVLSGSDQLRSFSFASTLGFDDHSFWVYGNLLPIPAVRLTLGGNFDQLNETMDGANLFGLSQFSPKVGISWDVLPSTTLRAAWFETLKRPLVGDLSMRSGETIEPTQVAGFNQLFDDPPGTKTRRWGIGIDQKLANPLFAPGMLLLGAEWSQRQLDVPIELFPGQVSEFGWNERFGRGYLSWLLSERLAFNTEVDYETINRPQGAELDGFAKIQLLQVPFELRYFDPNGLIGLVRTTIVREQGQFFDVITGEVGPGKGAFATLDMGIGWRYPGRPFIATLEVQNLLDSHFNFQDTDPLNPRILPRRTLLARVTLRL
jgi:outer membrane receptor protein involved in Fe transport